LKQIFLGSTQFEEYKIIWGALPANALVDKGLKPDASDLLDDTARYYADRGLFSSQPDVSVLVSVIRYGACQPGLQ